MITTWPQLQYFGHKHKMHSHVALTYFHFSPHYTHVLGTRGLYRWSCSFVWQKLTFCYEPEPLNSSPTILHEFTPMFEVHRWTQFSATIGQFDLWQVYNDNQSYGSATRACLQTSLVSASSYSTLTAIYFIKNKSNELSAKQRPLDNGTKVLPHVANPQRNQGSHQNNFFLYPVLLNDNSPSEVLWVVEVRWVVAGSTGENLVKKEEFVVYVDYYKQDLIS